MDKFLQAIKNLNLASQTLTKQKEFFTAVQTNAIATVRAMLITDQTLVHTRDTYGDTALHEAAANGFIEIAQLLIKYQADVNAVNASGSNPLLIAVLSNQTELAELMFEHGGDINSINHFCTNPVVLAYESHQFALVKIFLQGKMTMERFQPLLGIQVP